MIFRHPDDAVRAYVRAIERGGMATRSVAAHGREYETRCADPDCRAWRKARRALAKKHPGEITLPPPWIEEWSREAACMVQRCSHCMKPRRWVDSYVMGGHVGGGRTSRPPAAMLRVADLSTIGRMLEDMGSPNELGRGRATVYVRYVGTGKSIDMVSMEVTNERVDGRHWTGDDVRRAVRQARKWMERKLRDRGLLVVRSVKVISGGEACYV